MTPGIKMPRFFLLSVFLGCCCIYRLFCLGKDLSAKAHEHTAATFSKRGVSLTELEGLVIPLARWTDHNVIRITISAHIASPLKID